MSKPGEPRDILTKSQKAEIIQAYRDGEGYYAMAGRFGVSDSGIWAVLNRAGETRTRHIVTAEDHALAEAFCAAHRRTFTLDWQNAPVDRRPNHSKSLNEFCFDVVTPECAYWLGLLMADGSIVRYGNRAGNVVLQLTDPDQYQVYNFKQFMGSAHTITHIKAGLTSQNLNRKPAARLSVLSNRICHVLAEYGITDTKTYTSKAVHVENHPDFWRGAIDGDGSVKNDGVELVGSPTLVQQFSNFCSSIYQLAKTHIVSRGNINVGRINGKTAAMVMHSMYETDGPALQRKARQARAFYSRFYIEEP